MQIMLELIVLAIPMLLLGFRHALDLDHITAIDNLVRLYDKQANSRFIGFAFSAGHMLAVLGEMIIIILIIKDLNIDNIASIGSIAGISALLLISILNIYSLKKYGRNWSSIVARRVIKVRLTPLLSALITGIIFGLAFDTATQISAIALSSISSVTLGFQAALILAGIFAVGMVSLDTIDSMLLRKMLRRLRAKSYLKASYMLSISTLAIASLFVYEVITSQDIIPEWSGVIFAIASLSALFAISNN